MEENNCKLTYRTGWKIARSNDGYCLIKLSVPEALWSELNNMDVRLRHCKCRASWAKVEKIISIKSLEEMDHAASCYDGGFVYRKDAVVQYRKEYFSTDTKSQAYLKAIVDPCVTCGPGIHYFDNWLFAMWYLVTIYCDMQVDEFVDRVTKLDDMIQRGDI